MRAKPTPKLGPDYDDLPTDHWRPGRRGECPTERPCPFVGCRHHLLLDVTDAGKIKMAAPGDPVDVLCTMAETCVLDAADRAGGITLEEIGELFGVTTERARQIEEEAQRNFVALFEQNERGDTALTRRQQAAIVSNRRLAEKKERQRQSEAERRRREAQQRREEEERQRRRLELEAQREAKRAELAKKEQERLAKKAEADRAALLAGVTPARRRTHLKAEELARQQAENRKVRRAEQAAKDRERNRLLMIRRDAKLQRRKEQQAQREAAARSALDVGLQPGKVER